MKNIMHLHAGRSSELVSNITDFPFDLEGTKVAVCELLDAINFEAEMFATEENLITGLEGSMATLSIGVGLHIV